MVTDNARQQDRGRRRTTRTSVHANDRALIERYEATMRLELSDLLTSLQPVPQDQGLGMVAVPDKRPPLSERTKIWDLAIKLGRELGSAIEPDPLPEPPTSRPRKPRKLDL